MQCTLQRHPLLNLANLRFGATDYHTVHALRLRYQQEKDRDLWTPCEFAHLRFLHWWAETGVPIEDGGPSADEDGAGASGQ